MNPKAIHLTNVTLGLLVFGGIGLFTAWIYFIAGTIRGIPFDFPVLLILLTVWLASYFLQMKLKSIKSFIIIVSVELAILVYIYMQLSSQYTIIINF